MLSPRAELGPENRPSPTHPVSCPPPSALQGSCSPGHVHDTGLKAPRLPRLWAPRCGGSSWLRSARPPPPASQPWASPPSGCLQVSPRPQLSVGRGPGPRRGRRPGWGRHVPSQAPESPGSRAPEPVGQPGGVQGGVVRAPQSQPAPPANGSFAPSSCAARRLRTEVWAEPPRSRRTLPRSPPACPPTLAGEARGGAPHPHQQARPLGEGCRPDWESSGAGGLGTGPPAGHTQPDASTPPSPRHEGGPGPSGSPANSAICGSSTSNSSSSWIWATSLKDTRPGRESPLGGAAGTPPSVCRARGPPGGRALRGAGEAEGRHPPSQSGSGRGGGRSSVGSGRAQRGPAAWVALSPGRLQGGGHRLEVTCEQRPRAQREGCPRPGDLVRARGQEAHAAPKKSPGGRRVLAWARGEGLRWPPAWGLLPGPGRVGAP